MRFLAPFIAVCLAQAAVASHLGAVLCIGLATCTALALYGAFVIAAPGDRARIRALLQARSAPGT